MGTVDGRGYDESLRCQDLKIWRFFVDDDNANYDTTDYFTPCACTWGNNNNTVKLLEQSSGLNDTLFSLIISKLHGAVRTASAAGVPDCLIYTLGHWSSDAYQLYIQTPDSTLVQMYNTYTYRYVCIITAINGVMIIFIYFLALVYRTTIDNTPIIIHQL